MGQLGFSPSENCCLRNKYAHNRTKHSARRRVKPTFVFSWVTYWFCRSRGNQRSRQSGANSERSANIWDERLTIDRLKTRKQGIEQQGIGQQRMRSNRIELGSNGAILLISRLENNSIRLERHHSITNYHENFTPLQRASTRFKTSHLLEGICVELAIAHCNFRTDSRTITA